MWGRNHRENCGGAEARMVQAVDKHRNIRETMTDEEIVAFGIAYGGQKPFGKFTREWAAKVVTEVARSRLTGMMASWCMQTEDLLEVHQYLDYFVSKAPRQDKVAVGGDKDAPPIGIDCNHTIMTAGELVGKLIDDVGSRVSRGLPGPADKLEEPGLEAEELLLDPGQRKPGRQVPAQLGAEGLIQQVVVPQPRPQGPAAGVHD